MSKECFSELMQSLNCKPPVLHEKQKTPHMLTGTGCSLHIVHHTHTRTLTDYFRCRPFQVSIFVFIRFSVSYFKSSVQRFSSVTAFHIHPLSSDTSCLVQEEEKKREHIYSRQGRTA